MPRTFDPLSLDPFLACIVATKKLTERRFPLLFFFPWLFTSNKQRFAVHGKFSFRRFVSRYDADVRIVLDRPAIWSTGEIQHSLLRSISFLFQIRQLTPSIRV